MNLGRVFYKSTIGKNVPNKVFYGRWNNKCEDLEMAEGKAVTL